MRWVYSFLMYLQDEYSAIDDEFSILCDSILQIFYSYNLNRKKDSIEWIEHQIHSLYEKAPSKSKEDIEMILASILEYEKDMISEFNTNVK